MAGGKWKERGREWGEWRTADRVDEDIQSNIPIWLKSRERGGKGWEKHEAAVSFESEK